MYNVDEKVKEIKAILFDIISVNESVINNIEQQVLVEEDTDKINEIRILWEAYNSALKNSIANANLFIEGINNMDVYANRYASMYTNTAKTSLNTQVSKNVDDDVKKVEETPISLGTDLVDTDVTAITPEVQEVERESDEIDSISNDNISEKSEDDSVNVVPEGAVSVESVETSEVVVPEVEEKVVTVEAVPTESTEVAAPVAESTVEVEAVPAVGTEVAAPVAESTVEVEAVPAVSTEVAAPVAESAVEVEAVPAVSTEVAAPVAGSTVEVEAVPAVSTEVAAPVLPVVNEVPENENQVNHEESQLIKLSGLDEEKEVNDLSNKKVFLKEHVNDKAILINQSQANKLRSSRINQSAIFASLSSNDVQNVSESELEDMLNQVTALYKEGKQVEAEELSSKISVLSKKMTNNVTA